MGGALIAMASLGACTGDLEQLPADERTKTPAQFSENPREYIGGALAKCYSGIAVSGQTGAGSSDISGLDNGRSCWSRAIFMLNEFTTDECAWIWKDSGVFDLVTGTWSSNNENIFGTYSRLYTHIAICNDFLRVTADLGKYDITPADPANDGPATGDNRNISQKEVDQFRLEARALRGLSYFYVIDLFGNAAYCWDSQLTGEEPPQMSRADLFKAVTDDLEDVLTHWDEVEGSTVIYGRIGKDAVEALLAKYYLNAQVFTGQNNPEYWKKCWDHCTSVINRHKSGYNGTGLAADYLSLFCANNDMFAPGGSLPAQNEILWNIPYDFKNTESYGGSSFLILAAISDQTTSTPAWYGINGQWTCMHARQQFSENFGFSGGVSPDNRTFLWLTDLDGFTISNNDFSTYKDGYVPVKFTNVRCNPDGTMPRWIDPKTGLNRAGVHDLDNPTNYGINSSNSFADTDYPVIRLAEIYLTAAEAHLRGNVGNATDALAYINAVRERAGVGAWGNSDLTLDNILSERARELYWENCRRTDLVRFGRFTGSNYVWNWKNNIPTGAAMPDYMNVFPIPTSVINSYKSPYIQNKGY